MLETEKLPNLTFPLSLDSEGFHGPHREILENRLKEILKNSKGEPLIKQLPIISSSLGGGHPPTLTLYLLADERPHLFKFFYDVLYEWLIPYQTMGMPLLYTVDFAIPKVGLKLTYCELVARFESLEARDEAMKNFEYLKGQIALGSGSPWFARRLLELKGMSLDETTVTIHQHVHQIISRFGTIFDESFFQEMNYTLLSVPDPFKELRSARHLTRMVATSYLFKKEIEKEIEGKKDKRVLKVNLFRKKIGLKDKKRAVLGVAVGVNFLDQREFLEERHLLKAIQSYVPSATLVPGSFYTTRKEASKLHFLYLEVEKSTGAHFSLIELNLLRKELPSDLNDRIEKLIHPVFMPRNEEEIMRNMLQVAHEVKHVSDLPHVILSFEEQTQEELFYHVLIARVSGSKNRSFYDIFKSPSPMVGFQIEALKKVGIVKKRYPKEVCHLRARLPKELFMRKDLSVDLYKARGRLVKEIRLLLGHFRDLNGGMMAKEKELLGEIQRLIGEEEGFDEFLLENFYFSLQPIRLRPLIDPLHMSSLFLGMTRALREGKPLLKVLENGPFLALFHTTFPEVEVELQKIFQKLSLPPQMCLTANLKKDQSGAFGLFIEEIPQAKQEELLSEIKSRFLL